MSASAKFDSSINELSFIALVYAVSGWGLLEIWLFIMQAGFRWHSIAALPAGLLICLAIKGSPLYWRGMSREAARRTQYRASSSVDTWSVLVLLAAGILPGLLMIWGETVLLGIVVPALAFVPWMRLPLCRRHSGMSCMIIWVGSACTVLSGQHKLHPMSLPFACWVMWLCATFVLLRRIEKVRRLARDMNHFVRPGEIPSIAD